MSACGVTAHAILPIFGGDSNFEDPARVNKIIYGVLHSIVAVILVNVGGYRLFEKIMSVCIGTMFFIVVATAIAMQPNWRDVIGGLFIPLVPNDGRFTDAFRDTVALMGGVGGTVTILCYGYWIREENREGSSFIKSCRIDLATGYVMTAFFGLAMVVIGSRLGQLEGKGASLMVLISNELQATFGDYGGVARVVFLVGAWGAVFSSLLGVWQSVPYLFCDLRELMTSDLSGANTDRPKIDTKSFQYRAHLIGLAVFPMSGLFISFVSIQMVYAVFGALFIPLLAAALLVLNNKQRMEGSSNRWTSNVALVATLIFFSIYGIAEIIEKFS